MKNLAFILFILISFGKSFALPDIPANQITFESRLDYVDPTARVIVAGDRELSVPMNTPLFDTRGRAIDLRQFQAGHKVQIYIEKNPTGTIPTVKKLELLK